MDGDPAGARLVVGLLGPVEVGPAGGVMTPVAQPRLRVLLGLLAVAAGRVVSAEALVDGLWAEEWSPARERNLHALVYQLRRRLVTLVPVAGPGRARLARVGAGYRLALGQGELDVAAFRHLAGQGREAARAGDAAGARELFRQALGLWRGAALADAAPLCARLAGEAVRLEEARLAVVEERVECELALGRHAEVAGELAGLLSEFPLRERLAGLLMTALYRCGRRGDALAVYDAARRALADQLGLDPGPELAGLQAKVLHDDPALAIPAAAAPDTADRLVPRGTAVVGVMPQQLPAGLGFFAGREAELKELNAVLDRASGNGGAIVISAVAGMAGVGKTALAVHWARQVAARFPGGQLYVNLRGFDPSPAVTPEEAAGWFLVALGIPPAQIPADAQARYGLYRSALAGQRVLIVLDNARDAEQVRPLLPGAPGCLVVVTSRSALAGLTAAEGAHPVRLHPLSADEAVQLLAARLGPERVAAEPEAVTELITRCGHLPLALAVMAARAATDPELPLGKLASRLTGSADDIGAGAGRGGAGPGSGPLDVLETGDMATSLRSLLSWSYQQLSGPSAAMFALLGVHCGPDITVPAAASLAGVPVADARRALAELVDASLVAEHRPGRYVVHDLVRSYASEQARQMMGEAGIRAAMLRSLDHYLHTMIISSDTPRPVTPAPPAPGVVPERLADAQRIDWARAEHQVLLQATAQAAAMGLLTRAWQIFECQSWFLGGRGYWADLQAAGQAVLAAAEAAGDHDAQGWTHMVIGRYCTFTGAFGKARAHLTQAIHHFRQAGDLRGQAWTYLSVTRLHRWDGDWAQGAAAAGQALPLFRQTGERAGERWALYALGVHNARLANYELARGYARQALEAGTAAHDPTTQALAWSVLGLVHSRLGEHRQAISCFRQSLPLAHRWKTPYARGFLADILADFGDAHRAAGDLSAARQAWQQALQVLHDLRLPCDQEIRDRLGQAGLSPG